LFRVTEITLLENGKQTDILVMDFSKAFDKVSHSLLLHKLHYYDVQGELNSWIQNFLSNRKQAVVLEGDPGVEFRKIHQCETMLQRI
jgi:hypothetical protein